MRLVHSCGSLCLFRCGDALNRRGDRGLIVELGELVLPGAIHGQILCDLGHWIGEVWAPMAALQRSGISLKGRSRGSQKYNLPPGRHRLRRAGRARHIGGACAARHWHARRALGYRSMRGRSRYFHHIMRTDGWGEILMDSAMTLARWLWLSKLRPTWVVTRSTIRISSSGMPDIRLMS
jgi:hypothetical protein